MSISRSEAFLSSEPSQRSAERWLGTVGEADIVLLTQIRRLGSRPVDRSSVSAPRRDRIALSQGSWCSQSLDRQGYGKSMLIADNKTAEGRLLNLRVVLKIQTGE